jgi:hypothetical protein
VEISSRLKGRPTTLLSANLKKRRPQKKIRSLKPSLLHTKNQKGQNPTTQRVAMKTGKNSRRPIKSSM